MLNRVYTFWCILVAVVIFLVLYPFMWIFSQNQKSLWIVYELLNIWVKAFCFLVGIRINIKQNTDLDPKQNYIFCCNHFSSFDNLSVYMVVRRPFTVLALNEIGSLPLIGGLFKKMHILFDRKNVVSKTKAMLLAMNKIDNGHDLVIAPEGGIRSLHAPTLFKDFEDGAFRLAISKQIPIVPFVFKTNHLILPEFPLRYFHRHSFDATILEPIATKGLSNNDMASLKEKVREKMQFELKGCEETIADLSAKSKWNMIAEYR